MDKKPLISILMPVYNAMPYLIECIESILKQSESNWELIAVNDFSTDNSGETLQRYAEQNPKIKVFQNSYKGIIPALHLAFQQSKGELVTRMDADDIMSLDKLEILNKLLQKNGKGCIATARVKYFSEGILGQGYQRYEEWLNQLCEKNNHFEEIYKECVIPSPCWMIWRRDLIKCKAFTGQIYPEDYDLCFRFYQQKLKTVSSKKMLHYWRDYPSRSSRTKKEYAKQHYFDLKLPYFLQLDYQPNRPLILWGAGRKGKYLAQKLKEQSISFRWVCNTASKWGARIHNTIMEKFEIIAELEDPQIIISVAAPDGQIEIKNYLSSICLLPGKNYFFFC